MRNPSQQENSFCYRLSQVNENVDYWLAFKTANAEIGSMKPINNKKTKISITKHTRLLVVTTG